MENYIKKFAEWSSSNNNNSNNSAKPHKYPSPPSSPVPPSNAMSLKQNFLKDSTPRVNNGSSLKDSNNFDNVTQTPITGRLLVNIVEGHKLNVSNYQAKPYCVVEFERNEVVTREAIKDDLSSRGKPMEFLDLVRAATSPVWRHKAVL